MNGDELKARRKGMGYTQDGLARVLGVSRKTINEMENGGTIDTRTKLAVLAESRRVKVLENTFWVMPTIRNSYAVAQRVNRRAKGTPDRRRTRTPLASRRTCMERATFALLAA